jgi:triacylglycerol lipase
LSPRRHRERHAIYLVPGFFGFTNLGRFRYFSHVERFLRARSAERGIDARVVVVPTHPTASLPRRAALLLETLARTRARRGESIHLVGHSTGGIDARLVASPGVALPTRLDVERFASRVHSVIGVSSPQHGTPLAAYLTTRRGQRALALLSLTTSYVLRFGHLPLSALLGVAAFFRRGETRRLGTLIDDLSQQLLEDFSLTRRRAVGRLLRDVFEDQSLLTQLTPEAMDLFSAAVSDRPGVRYGSVVTRSRPPGVRTTLAAGLGPGAQAIHAIYGAIYRLAAQTPARAAPQPDAAQRRALAHGYGKVPGAHANDGIVPTRAQVHGRVIAAVRADHLDVIGHFNDPAADPPHFDWLTTGSGFDRARFEAVWDGVLDFLLA